MIIGNIRSIKSLSNSNRNIFVIAGGKTCTDIDKIDELFESLSEQTVIAGDCLELNYIVSGSVYHFKVFEENGGVYKLDTNQSLCVDFSKNPAGDIEYCSNITEKQSAEDRRQLRKSKIDAVLNDDGI
ncbi:hypothetical protein GCM10027443_18110 [Pontibacter brevis]